MTNIPKDLELSPLEVGKLGLNRSEYFELCDKYWETKCSETRLNIKKDIESIIWLINM